MRNDSQKLRIQSIGDIYVYVNKIVGNNDEDEKMIHESSEPPGDQAGTMTRTTYRRSHEQSREREGKRVTFADVVKYGKPKTSKAKKTRAHSLEIIKTVK